MQWWKRVVIRELDLVTIKIVGTLLAINNTYFRGVAVVNSKNSDTISRQSIETAQIIVGTSCAGTGLDITNVGLIIVVGMPFSIEQLLQWAGRCRVSGMIIVIVPSWQIQGGGELAGLNIAGRIGDIDVSKLYLVYVWPYTIKM